MGVGLWNAIGRRFKAFFAVITFRQRRLAAQAEQRPEVMAQQYDEVIDERRAGIETYKSAIAELKAHNRSLTAQAERLENGDETSPGLEQLARAKAGAAGKAKKIVESFKAKNPNATPEEIKAHLATNQEYLTHQAAYTDFAEQYNKKKERFDDLSAKVDANDKKIAGHMVNLRKKVSENQNLQSEKVDAVADMTMANHEKAIHDAFSGLGEDESAQKLATLRSNRHKVVAEAEISAELAGADKGLDVDNYIEAGAVMESNTEFDALMGIASTADRMAAERPPVQKDTILPEN